MSIVKNYSVRSFIYLLAAICLALSLSAISSVYAADKTYSLSFTGTDGSTGTVVFTIDDSIATTGISVDTTSCSAAVELHNLTLTLTGGTVPGGTQTWGCSHVTQFTCSGNAGATLPCGMDFNFGVDNGTASMLGTDTNVQDLSWIAGSADESSFGVMIVVSPTVSAPLFSTKEKAKVFSEIEYVVRKKAE